MKAIKKFPDNTTVQEHGRKILKLMSTSAGARKHSARQGPRGSEAGARQGPRGSKAGARSDLHSWFDMAFIYTVHPANADNQERKKHINIKDSMFCDDLRHYGLQHHRNYAI